MNKTDVVPTCMNPYILVEEDKQVSKIFSVITVISGMKENKALRKRAKGILL